MTKLFIFCFLSGPRNKSNRTKPNPIKTGAKNAADPRKLKLPPCSNLLSSITEANRANKARLGRGKIKIESIVKNPIKDITLGLDIFNAIGFISRITVCAA